jgi:dihydropteroate synthase
MIQHARKAYTLTLRGSACLLGARTWIMGVLNVTPDSFSDGARFAAADDAVAEGLAQFEAGADIVDVGGESTRPGAQPVPAEEEIGRVVPVIEGLRRRDAGFLSIDTTKAAVARAALDAGADLVNDVSGFRYDAAMATLVAQRGVPAVLMHLRGDFQAMHRQPAYGDVGREVAGELSQRAAEAERAGVARAQIVLDPGLGFAKDAAHTLELVRRLPELASLGRPLLLGPSRKSFIGRVLDLPAGERLFGTAAAVAACVLGGAHIVRVHDVGPMSQVARVCDAILGAGPEAGRQSA